MHPASPEADLRDSDILGFLEGSYVSRELARFVVLLLPLSCSFCVLLFCVLLLLRPASPASRFFCVLRREGSVPFGHWFRVPSSRSRHSRQSRTISSRARPLRAMSQCGPQISCVLLILRPAPSASCSFCVPHLLRSASPESSSFCVLFLLRPPLRSVFHRRGSAIRGSRALYPRAHALFRRFFRVNTQFSVFCFFCVLLLLRFAPFAFCVFCVLCFIITAPPFAEVPCYILTRLPFLDAVPVSTPSFLRSASPASCSFCVPLLLRPAYPASCVFCVLCFIITVPPFAEAACYILTRSPAPGGVQV